MVVVSRCHRFCFLSRQNLSAYGLKILLLLGFIVYFAFAMSSRYGRPAFPVRGYLFSNNSGQFFALRTHRIERLDSGFALLIFVLLAVFIYAWEKILRRALERLVDVLAKSAGKNAVWTRIQPTLGKFFW